MTRKNNPSDMTIREQMERVRDDVCDWICKYNEDFNNKIRALKGNDQTLKDEIIDVLERELEKHCDQCPLSRL